jgi:hypothetical protein
MRTTIDLSRWDLSPLFSRPDSTENQEARANLFDQTGQAQNKVRTFALSADGDDHDGALARNLRKWMEAHLAHAGVANASCPGLRLGSEFRHAGLGRRSLNKEQQDFDRNDEATS